MTASKNILMDIQQYHRTKKFNKINDEVAIINNNIRQFLITFISDSRFEIKYRTVFFLFFTYSISSTKNDQKTKNADKRFMVCLVFSLSFREIKTKWVFDKQFTITLMFTTIITLNVNEYVKVFSDDFKKTKPGILLNN